MKSIFKLAAIAIVAMSLTTACKSKTEAPVEDTMPIEEAIVEDTVVEAVAEAVVAEEPVKKAVTKKEVKKEETADPNAAPKVGPTDLSKKTDAPAASQRATTGKASDVKVSGTDLSKEGTTRNPAQRGRR